MLVGIELARSCFTLLARQPLASHMTPHRVARHMEYPRNLANTLAVPSQNPVRRGRETAGANPELAPQ
jgi:hypothetical protein